MTVPRIAIVGHCAAGKSTVVTLLVQQGLDAYSVAQEHSIVHDLWAHQQPDILVFLDVSLVELRKRKANPDWPEWIFIAQNQRLEHAREHADIVIGTDDEAADAVVAEIAHFLNCI
jgi:deoxyadenosine/deoxycytidine kinase